MFMELRYFRDSNYLNKIPPFRFATVEMRKWAKLVNSV